MQQGISATQINIKCFTYIARGTSETKHTTFFFYQYTKDYKTKVCTWKQLNKKGQVALSYRTVG